MKEQLKPEKMSGLEQVLTLKNVSASKRYEGAVIKSIFIVHVYGIRLHFILSLNSRDYFIMINYTISFKIKLRSMIYSP